MIAVLPPRNWKLQRPQACEEHLCFKPVLVGDGPRCHALRLANLIQLCDDLGIHLGPRAAGISSFARPVPYLLAATTVDEDAAAVGLAIISLQTSYRSFRRGRLGT